MQDHAVDIDFVFYSFDYVLYYSADLNLCKHMDIL